MKVLVTGASGFIGNYVVEQLLSQGIEVIATSVNIENARAKHWFKQVTYIPFDLSHIDPSVDYHTFFDAPDALVHLAWEGLPNYKNDFHVNENLPRHFAFLQNLVQNGCRNITVTGTCFEYGLKEGCLTEDMTPAPANPYALAKDMLRKKVAALPGAPEFKWVRLFYMYGEGQNPNSIIPQLEKAIMNGEASFNMSPGDQQRDYLHVRDVATYICAIALQPSVTGIINCCSGKPVTVKAFIESYLAGKNQSIRLNTGFYPYSDLEPFAFWGDTAKLKQIIH